MKKTRTVNIGGQVFNIDEDAFVKLEDYLQSIESHFVDEKERKEIMMDIENRIAEIFNEYLTPHKQVITIKNVSDMITIMGNASDFAKENGPVDDNPHTGSSYRRIYRDPDNRVLGGVCGGLGLYWHIDPLILRIAFIIAFLGFGVGLFIYLLLWIIIPKARTTAQKLEMMGEPVTIKNISKHIKEEFEEVKRRMYNR